MMFLYRNNCVTQKHTAPKHDKSNTPVSKKSG